MLSQQYGEDGYSRALVAGFRERDYCGGGDHRAFDGHVRRALAATDRRGAHAAKGRALVCHRRRRRRRRMRRDERNASLYVRVQFAGRLGSAAAIVSRPRTSPPSSDPGIPRSQLYRGSVIRRIHL